MVVLPLPRFAVYSEHFYTNTHMTCSFMSLLVHLNMIRLMQLIRMPHLITIQNRMIESNQTKLHRHVQNVFAHLVLHVHAGAKRRSLFMAMRSLYTWFPLDSFQAFLLLVVFFGWDIERGLGAVHMWSGFLCRFILEICFMVFCPATARRMLPQVLAAQTGPSHLHGPRIGVRNRARLPHGLLGLLALMAYFVPEIEEKMILVDSWDDENEFPWHMRMLHYQTNAAGVWICSTPDYETQRIDLNEHRVVPFLPTLNFHETKEVPIHMSLTTPSLRRTCPGAGHKFGSYWNSWEELCPANR